MKIFTSVAFIVILGTAFCLLLALFMGKFCSLNNVEKNITRMPLKLDKKKFNWQLFWWVLFFLVFILYGLVVK